jgi:hypothetical protein
MAESTPERAVRPSDPPRRFTSRLATEQDLRKIFGSGNLLIGGLVRPRRDERSEETPPESEEIS